MRVITGSAKGYKLAVPKYLGVKPVKDIVKQAVFSVLGDTILGTDILDLFAGSGSIGIEALSRGAKFCVFVDNNRKCVDTIRKNLINTKLLDRSEVVLSDAAKYIRNNRRMFDYIFIDAPYHMRRIRYIYNLLPAILKKNGLVIYLHAKKNNEEFILTYNKFKIIDTRSFGRTSITFLKLDSPQSDGNSGG